jgi:autotransporter-associated beta strand protein
MGLPAGSSTEDLTEYTVGMARQEARELRVYAGSLAKFGQGVLTLNGQNTFSGGVSVRAGALVAASAQALGAGDVEVMGGTLATRFSGPVNIAGGLMLGAGSQLDLGLGAGNVGSFLLGVAGAAAFDGMLTVSFLDGFVFGEPAVYDLISAGSHAGQFNTLNLSGLQEGYVANLIYGSNSVALNLAAVLEPGTWLLLAGGLALVAWRTRKRRQTAA